MCDTSVLHREIPDPKQRCAEVLTPSFAGTALQLGPCAAVSAEHCAVWRQHWDRAPLEVHEAALPSLLPSMLWARIASRAVSSVSHAAQALCLRAPLPEEGFGGKWPALVSMLFLVPLYYKTW